MLRKSSTQEYTQAEQTIVALTDQWSEYKATSCVFHYPKLRLPRMHTSVIVVRYQARSSVNDLGPITLTQTNLLSRTGEGATINSLEGEIKIDR